MTSEKQPSLGTEVYLSLGSNVGDRYLHLRNGLQNLKAHMDIAAVSSGYITSPVDYLEQDTFINICVSGKTNLSAKEFLKAIIDIQNKNDFTKTIHKGPRELDIDIIFFGILLLDAERLEIPHPRYKERKFVLVPLLEIKHNIIDPRTKEPIENYLKKLVDTDNDQSIARDKVWDYKAETWL